jgi:histidinol-phosphate aminotransferase
MHLHQHVASIPLRQRTRKDCGINLANNELAHPGILDLLQEAVNSLSPASLRSYVHPPDVVESIARFVDLHPDHVVPCAGADDAIKTIMSAFAATSHRLVTQEPNYEHHYAKLFQIDTSAIVFGQREPGAFAMEQYDVLNSLAPSTVLITNPHNPSGFFHTLGEIEDILSICKRRGHLCVIDETYAPYSGSDHLSLVRDGEPVVVIRSLSKSHGLAGIRVGFIAAPKELASYLRRWNTAASFSAAALGIMEYLFANDSRVQAIIRDVMSSRDWFIWFLSQEDSPVGVMQSAANFVNVVLPTPSACHMLCAYLRANDVLTRNLAGVRGLERCVRVTMADLGTTTRVAHCIRNGMIS